jgi:hypothetical protein
MFKNSTVFVLGAGASWHYGYPTGEDFVESVISAAERFFRYCQLRFASSQIVQLIPDYIARKIDDNRGFAGAREGWEDTQNECVIFIERLKTVRPLLIDHFLAWNESLSPIGKMMIAAAILEREAAWLREKANLNRMEGSPRVRFHRGHHRPACP